MVVAYSVPEDVKRLVLLNRWKFRCARAASTSWPRRAASPSLPMSRAAQPVQGQALALGVSLDRLQSVLHIRDMESLRERVRQLFVLVLAGADRWRRGALFDFYARDRAAQLLTQSLSATPR